MGASVSDDPHPILAVLSNIITRGLATKPSPFVERSFCKANDVCVETSNNGIIDFDLTIDKCYHSHCALDNLYLALEIESRCI